MACARALKLQAIGYQSVKNILARGLEGAEIQQYAEESSLPLFHENLRGSEYYARGAA